MTDRLLPLYDAELGHLRRMAAEFADAHPKVAGRLRLSADAIDDPHVSRLLEGFAFIAARIRQKLDDEYPEITDALLGGLYPHLLAPFPSCTVLEFTQPPGSDDGFLVRRGTRLQMEPVEGEACQYRTTQDAELWPVSITRAELSGRPLRAPLARRFENALATLRIVLETPVPGGFTHLGLDRLRFFLRAPTPVGPALMQLLCCNLLGAAVADHPEDEKAVMLPGGAVTQSGFADDTALLPHTPRTQPGYRLLTEFFGFPAKFMFVDVAGLAGKTLRGAGSRIELFFYLDRLPPGLERQVRADSFALGCAPAINLFAQRAEPLMVTHETSDYLVLPDARRHATREVHSVDRVTLAVPGVEPVEALPFWASHHAADPGRQRLFYATSRRRLGERDDSTDVFLALVDAELSPATRADGVLTVETTCMNRDLPARLPYGGVHPVVTLADGAAELLTVRCLLPPTATLRPPTAERSGWRLLSHLSLNHLSLSGPEGADALREILRLHDVRDLPETRAVLDAVRAVSSRRATARLTGSGALCSGLDVDLELDGRLVDSGTAYLFTAVVERFLALYASINAFSRLSVRLHGRGELNHRWPARAGDKPLL